ncbi:MAG: hypothetical protein F4Z94_07735 [Chloroflexi bacterium]|nr:hypothetical protein [Chloroflexota bacterium]
MLFRSEAEIDSWLLRKGAQRGAVLSLERVWALAQRWYAERMSPHFRGRTTHEAQIIFRQLGLRGEFWSVAQRK